MSFSERPEQRPVVPGPQARQGVTGHNVRYVLTVGLGATIAMMVVIYMFFMR